MLKAADPILSSPASSGACAQRTDGMHFRFEVNYIVDEITGAPPVVRVLEIAWLEKRQHIRQFLLDYYRRFRTLPEASHDLGSTAIHHLQVGVIDFRRVRERIRERIRRRREGGRRMPRWVAWIGEGLGRTLRSKR